MATGNFDINELKRRMQGAIQSLKHELGGLRTGRASASMLDPVQVEAYGTHMPLNQLATVSVPEPRLISVQVWDKSMVKPVEKAIVDSNLGLSPATEGQVLRLRIPELNQERRKELVKVAHKYAEAAKVAVRHVRRDGLDILKKLEKNHEMSEDDQERLAGDVQKATDGTIAEVDQLLAAKEKEILTVERRLHVERRRARHGRTGQVRGPRACCHHHGWQRALGGRARPAAGRGPSPRRRGAAARRPCRA